MWVWPRTAPLPASLAAVVSVQLRRGIGLLLLGLLPVAPASSSRLALPALPVLVRDEEDEEEDEGGISAGADGLSRGLSLSFEAGGWWEKEAECVVSISQSPSSI